VSTEDQMSIEDRVRTATRAGASMVREIRPLTAPRPVRLRRRPAPRSRRWLNWGIPLVAAAAVVAIALTLVAVRQPATPAPAASRPAPAAPTVPRYYVALDGTGTGHGPLIVGDDLTGKTIATVSPPHGVDFISVQGTFDDRTFAVVAEGQSTPSSFTWYLLRIIPGSAHPYQLTALPITMPVNTPAASVYALSPDGQELAVESESSSRSSSGWVTTLGIYSVSSGATLHAWTMPAATAKSPPIQLTLSWLSDGRQLAFSTVQSTSPGVLSAQLRTLDVTGSGTGLMTASRALLTVPLSGASTCWTMHLTPDGGTVVCGTQYHLLSGNGSSAGCPQGGLEFTAYSVLTGKPIRVLYQYRGACSKGWTFVPWTSASATEIIGEIEANPHSGGKPADQVGVITNGHIRLFKIAKSVSIAF
jgi:dipeptidyl aminopeptidase/acylaminoacyl peptidase